MLSVLIPIYNVNVHPLVSELQTQLAECGVDYEIILSDDASSDLSLRYHNSLLAQQDNVRYIQHEVNLGRSATRNELADEAQFPLLLVMDGDARVEHSDYIATFLHFVKRKELVDKDFVISGGLSYRDKRPERYQRLRYVYGIRREVRSSAERNIEPYRHFTPFNMLIAKSVFTNVRFDETLTTYGYEDTFFGMDLQTNGIPVLHIDNELYHDGLDDNRDFLRKIESSVKNLARLYHDGRVDDRFRAQSHLLRTWEKYSNRFYGPAIFGMLRISRWFLKKMMFNWNCLRAMDLYKLSLLDEFTGSPQ